MRPFCFKVNTQGKLPEIKFEKEGILTLVHLGYDGNKWELCQTLAPTFSSFGVRNMN